MTTLQKDPGAQRVVLIGICLLLSAALPLWRQTLFVEETGHFSTSPTLPAALLIGLLLRWHLARPALLCLILLYLCADFFAFSHAPDKVGFLLIAPLHLIAFVLLGFSRDVVQYLQHPGPTR